MPEIEDRLLPCDGLNNYNVFLTRMDLEPQGSAQFTFSVTHSMMPIGEFVVPVAAQAQGLDRMAVEAHDGLLDILRQLMFRADKARTALLKQTERFEPAAEPVQEENEFSGVLDGDQEETSF